MKNLIQDESGFSIIEVAMVLPVYILLLVGAVDFGRGYYMAIETSAAAEAGAMYGSQNSSDTSGMVSAALLDANDVPGMDAVGTYGCECSDGTAGSVNCTSVPSCSANVVNYVQVDTSANYQPMFALPGIPTVMTLRGSSRMRVAH